MLAMLYRVLGRMTLSLNGLLKQRGPTGSLPWGDMVRWETIRYLRGSGFSEFSAGFAFSETIPPLSTCSLRPRLV